MIDTINKASNSDYVGKLIEYWYHALQLNNLEALLNTKKIQFFPMEKIPWEKIKDGTFGEDLEDKFLKQLFKKPKSEKQEEEEEEGKNAFFLFGNLYKIVKTGKIKGNVFFIVPFTLYKDKTISISENDLPRFNRKNLEPQESSYIKRITLGSCEEVFDYLEHNKFCTEDWTLFLEDCLLYFKKITNKDLNSIEFTNSLNQTRKVSLAVVGNGGTDAASYHLRDTLITLSYRKNRPVLFEKICIGQEPKKEIKNSEIRNRMFLSAHIDSFKASGREVFPLDPSQRKGLLNFLNLTDGNVLAINGPPGSGKTSMLRAVISSTLLNYILDDNKPDCPIIVACAATNQAVTNIIESFDSIASLCDSENLLYKRWISNAPSYGWYFPSKSKLGDKTNIEKYQLLIREQLTNNWKFRGAASILYIDSKETQSLNHLVKQYFENFKAYKNINFNVTLSSIQKSLKEDIELYGIKKILVLRKQLNGLIKKLRKVKKQDTKKHERILEKELNSFTTTLEIVGNENSHFSTFKEKVNEINKDIDKNLYEDLLNDVWEKFENVLDCTIRVKVFHLIMRYMEGGWLFKLKQRRKSADSDNIVETIRHHCMIAPCIVVTAFTLPKLMKLSSQINQISKYHFNSIDLLIVDEAGQMQSEVGASCFSFAKKAIIVGDTYQIEPVWQYNKTEDLMLQKQVNISPEFIEKIIDSEVSISNGSIMRMAQKATYFSRMKEGEPGGLLLRRHYRCVPTIIEFCNKLIYKDELIPIRKELTEPLFPPMSYMEVPGKAIQNEGSWCNPEEARIIAKWLRDKIPEIRKYYKKHENETPSIDTLVAIVTPFKAQINVIKAELKTYIGQESDFKDEATKERCKKIVVGTTHALQGAERPIILFSSVITPKNRSSFIDRSSSLLNVAVSRAKDIFILVCHPDIFINNPPESLSGRPLPTEVLSDYITAHGKLLFPKSIVIVESPNKAKLFEDWLGLDYKVFATGGHFRYLDMEQNAIDIKNDYKVKWTFDKMKYDIFEEILYWLKKVNNLIIATDDDREGEAIAWHLTEFINEKLPDNTIDIKRMRYHEITETSIKSTIEKTADTINVNKAKAALTRNIIDYIIGKYLSEALRVKAGEKSFKLEPLSIGRVQAAILYLLKEYEKVRIDKNDKCLQIKAQAKIDEQTVLGRILDNTNSPFFNQEEYEKICNILNNSLKVTKVIKNEQKITTGERISVDTATILKEAFLRFGYSPGKTMNILQNLYEGIVE